MPDKASSYLFPPLDSVFRGGAIILCVLVSIIVFFTSYLPFVHSGRRRVFALISLGGLALLGLLLFLISHTRFVRTIDIPSKADTITVSVGYRRSAFANSQLPNKDDWDLLIARGTSEQEIQRLWTPSSIILARLTLLSTYLLCLLAAVAVGCLGVLYEGIGPPTLP
jgi:hypothetical protein